jgi:hypothetical protein
MPGRKTFVNNSGSSLAVTLYIRQGDDPANQSGTQMFPLAAGQTATVTYGTDTNSGFLNGLSLASTTADSSIILTQVVATRGSAWDNVLNQNSVVVIGGFGGLQVTSHN